ncbi:DUF2612 domain-containing protein [Serratia sp. S1B]|nr:DUF2612 domain-containing protein [Serratia sp. S1B]
MSRKRADFLIWQYRRKPKARQTIGLLLYETQRLFESSIELANILNINISTRYALDLVGRHVGMGRVMKSFVPKTFFGWDAVDTAYGFNIGLFYRYKDSLTDSITLDDEDYRFFIKAKAAKNYQSPVIENITFAVRNLLGRASFVIDNYDMTMNIVTPSTELTPFRLYAIQHLDILVRPVGVSYQYLVITNAKPFGWLGNTNAFGFNVGKFTRLINVSNN